MSRCPEGWSIHTVDRYDHAGYHSSLPGRFLSPDRAYGSPEAPQTWNRYSYAQNNPLRVVDLDGKEPTIFQDAFAKVQPVADAAAVYAQVMSGASAGLGEGAAQVAGLVDLAARTLNMGTATGEAIGSGADAFTLTKAIVGDAKTFLEAFVAMAGAAKSLGADTTKVVHFTNDANMSLIESSGELRGANGAWVTKPGEVKGLTPSQIEAKLGIDPGKGQNSITMRVKNSNLRVPENGPRTQPGGAWQRRLNQPCSIEGACIERAPN